MSPHGRVIGQYGVEAYRVNYTVNTYHDTGGGPSPAPLCEHTNTTQGTSVAPTVYTGWRVVPG